MNYQKKTALIVFLTFIITSALYFTAFTALPALSLITEQLRGALFDTNKELTEKISSIDALLESEYINEFEQKELNDTAVKGYLAALGDKYSQYYTKDEFDELNQSVEGTYKGIGIEVTLDSDNLITVINVFDASPAAKAGIRINDRIIKVGETDVTGDNYDTALNMIKGVGKYAKGGDDVKLTLKRGEETLEATVTREELTADTVLSKMLESNIGYVRLSSFDEESDEQFIRETDKLIADGARGIIIDLRNNGGGLLTTVVNIADYLLPKGKILTINRKNGDPAVFSSDENWINLPMCVIINNNSASASEVLAGALKDNKKAILVGETSYGKGVVQTLYPLSDGSGVKLTTAKYYTPSGVCIDHKGITPDIEVKMELEKALEMYSAEEDVQLTEAIKQLK